MFGVSGVAFELFVISCNHFSYSMLFWRYPPLLNLPLPLELMLLKRFFMSCFLFTLIDLLPFWRLWMSCKLPQPQLVFMWEKSEHLALLLSSYQWHHWRLKRLWPCVPCHDRGSIQTKAYLHHLFLISMYVDGGKRFHHGNPQANHIECMHKTMQCSTQHT